MDCALSNGQRLLIDTVRGQGDWQAPMAGPRLSGCGVQAQRDNSSSRANAVPCSINGPRGHCAEVATQIEQFQKTRNAPGALYSVAGKDAGALTWDSTDAANAQTGVHSG